MDGLTLPRLKPGDSRNRRGMAFEMERTSAIPDFLYARGLPDPNRSHEVAHPSEEGGFMATALPLHTTILAQGRETGKARGPFIPWLKPRGFLADFL
jgi:hypothetical protein